ncbi:MAG: vitamin K epoxide reductase family protein [Luteolibacter sp.]
MSEQSASPRPSVLDWLLDLVILILALAGFAINELLLAKRVADADIGIAGCGGGSACELVLNSRWSQIFGLPVTIFGMLVYLGLMFSMAPRGHRLLAPMLGAIAAAALWFTFVQAILLGKFCPWCMTGHALGTIIFVLGVRRLWNSEGLASAGKQLAISGSLAFFALALSQLYGPLPATHRIENTALANQAEPIGIHARGEGRKVSFAGGTRGYNATALPHIGSDQAKHVLIEYFDYQCPVCQSMRGYLAALIEKHPQDICVVLLPVPLNGECNHFLGPLEAGHPGSCEYARLALAVWKSHPIKFPEFHEMAFTGASLEDCRRFCEKFISPEKLEAALRDPWITELIEANIADWVSFSRETKKLPKLLITGKRILQGLPPSEADFIRVMERELGL